MKAILFALIVSVMFVSVSAQVTVDDAAKSALNVGGKMPSFTLNDSLGKAVTSKDLLKQGNLVVVFYRGAWCPFCNKYLNTLQKNMSQIKAAGGHLVAISVENADRSQAVAKKNDLTYTVLSDPNLTVARMFKIVYQMPDDLNAKYRSGGLDVAKYNSMEEAELPISATYIVNRKGEITYAHIEPDYKKRPTPDEIIAALVKVK
ncbi:MAG: AhpC/TSA family protein [Acidobacteria bacterium]|nr:AhpC/TSA family protein [Acidobacteriota bacterium]MBK9528230.1 AhpC/TSA family protein [Acidobacteriota bacterium]MBP7474952.1 AhpC/TSA family protein [Pyrinomonadaceae bacterium]MBP9110864.1 AhpC/TSA family protein [Pyrinomonadaceae bacterium]